MALKNQDRRTNEELEELLEQLGKLLDRTKILYEQYFMGIQKLPPDQLHRDIERRIRDLTQEHIRNTGLRYRLTTLKQKFGSYNTYWRRVLREIEQGRYFRDVARAGRRAAAKGEDLPPEILANMPERMRKRIMRDRQVAQQKADRDEAFRAGRTGGAMREKFAPGHVHSLDEGDAFGGGDFDLDAMFDAITSADPGTLAAKPPPAAAKPPSPSSPARNAAPSKPVAPPPRPSTAPPPPKPRPPATPPSAASRVKPPPGMSEQGARDLFNQYVKAKKLVGERTESLTYDKLMGSLNKQAPDIMSKHGASGVDFGVVIKNDKVVLKAKPKK